MRSEVVAVGIVDQSIFQTTLSHSACLEFPGTFRVKQKSSWRRFGDCLVVETMPFVDQVEDFVDDVTAHAVNCVALRPTANFDGPDPDFRIVENGIAFPPLLAAKVDAVAHRVEIAANGEEALMQNVLFFTVVKLVWNARQDVVVVGHDVDEKLRPCTGDSCKQHEHEAAGIPETQLWGRLVPFMNHDSVATAPRAQRAGRRRARRTATPVHSREALEATATSTVVCLRRLVCVARPSSWRVGCREEQLTARRTSGTLRPCPATAPFRAQQMPCAAAKRRGDSQRWDSDAAASTMPVPAGQPTFVCDRARARVGGGAAPHPLTHATERCNFHGSTQLLASCHACEVVPRGGHRGRGTHANPATGHAPR